MIYFYEMNQFHGYNPFISFNRFSHTSGVTVYTPTDRTKSVRNRCVIKVFGAFVMLSRCFLDLSVGVGAFVIGLSQISFFFLFSYPQVDDNVGR